MDFLLGALTGTDPRPAPTRGHQRHEATRGAACFAHDDLARSPHQSYRLDRDVSFIMLADSVMSEQLIETWSRLLVASTVQFGGDARNNVISAVPFSKRVQS